MTKYSEDVDAEWGELGRTREIKELLPNLPTHSSLSMTEGYEERGYKSISSIHTLLKQE